MQTIISISAFLITSMILFVLVRYSKVIGINDVPNERSAHKKITPRSGGIAIFTGFITTQLVLNFDHLATYSYIYIATFLIFIIGFLDDKFDVSPRWKFLVIFFATVILYMNGIEISSGGVYFGYHLVLPLVLVLPFTFFAIAGFTNSMNLMDGLDGLSSSIAMIILSTFLAVGWFNDDTLMITLSASLMASIVAFLLFNWHPAKIFMGDSGSLTIGFVIALLSALSLKYITPPAVMFIIALPLLDTFIVMTRRIQRGRSPFSADKNHLHHLLLNLKGDVPFVVILLASIQLVFSIIGFQLHKANDITLLFLFALLFYVFLQLFDPRLRRRTKHKSPHIRAQHLKDKHQPNTKETNV